METRDLSPFPLVQQFLRWLPPLGRTLWILAAGQLLLFIGQGFTLVYGSIYFVNELGFSPTQVGLALGSGGLSGTLGRLWGGTALDRPGLGRRGTLLLAAVVAAAGCFALATARNFGLLVGGNLLLGLGISLYWPATLAVITDLAPSEYRTEAMALTRLADNLGLGVGALLAGAYIALDGSYSALFVAKGLVYLAFAVVIYATIAETRPDGVLPGPPLRQWGQALQHRPLLIYLGANLFFTTYAAQLTSTLPLYLANGVPLRHTVGFTPTLISACFAGHALIKIVFQLPLTRSLRGVDHVPILGAALGLWLASFALLTVLGLPPVGHYGAALPVALAAFGCIAIAEVLYAPSAVALVGDMAPAHQRGVYFALESQCWTIGLLVGPALGGWALDHPQPWGSSPWPLLALSGVGAALLLVWLGRQSTLGPPQPEPTPTEPQPIPEPADSVP